MLPYFAASGHNNYTRSASLYLQKMQDLKSYSKDVFLSVSQQHSLRRTDRYWAALSLDLIIEQVLNLDLKTPGGLTMGTGFDEKQRAIWTLAKPVLACYSYSMQKLTNVNFDRHQKHVDCTESRMKQDAKDLVKLKTFL